MISLIHLLHGMKLCRNKAKLPSSKSKGKLRLNVSYSFVTERKQSEKEALCSWGMLLLESPHRSRFPPKKILRSEEFKAETKAHRMCRSHNKSKHIYKKAKCTEA